MERIYDEILIQYLQAFYAARYEFGKTGVESLKKAWFIDQANQQFCLCRIARDEDNAPIPNLQAICRVDY